MTLVTIDTRRIRDWETFHDVFAEALGFPSSYGRNMNAWIDCLSAVGDPDDSMTKVHAPVGGVLALQLEYVADFTERCPDQYAAIIECAAFVNWRLIEEGKPPVLVVSFCKDG